MYEKYLYPGDWGICIYAGRVMHASLLCWELRAANSSKNTNGVPQHERKNTEREAHTGRHACSSQD